MKKIKRRDRIKIYGDLLSALHIEAGLKKIVLTQIQVKINVPYDRLTAYIKELVGLGLIQDEVSLRLTEKGKQYLTEYEKVLKFLNRMGLSY